MKLKRLLEDATPGIWQTDTHSHYAPLLKTVNYNVVMPNIEDAELICHLQNNADKYVELVRTAKNLIELDLCDKDECTHDGCGWDQLRQALANIGE